MNGLFAADPVYTSPVVPDPIDATTMLIKLMFLTGFGLAICLAAVWLAKPKCC